MENLAGVDFDNHGNANDRISSVRIEGNATVLLYESARFRGNVLRLTESVANLADRPGADPDAIVKRVYNDLLGRDPDPEGQQLYRRLIIEKGWSEQQVRDAIRRGNEYKNRPK